MHDDEFLSQFRKDPRPEFTDALRAKLAREDLSEKGTPMTRIVSFPPSPSVSETIQNVRSPRGKHFVTLVATVVLAVLFGAMIVANVVNNVAAPLRITSTTFEYGGQVTNPNSEKTIGAMKQSGMTWIKIEKYFTGVLATDSADEIAAAHARGFKVLIKATGSDKTRSRTPIEYSQAYAEWVGKIAAAGADAIEIWDEPNAVEDWRNVNREMFAWPGDMIYGYWYAELLRESSVAIKTLNPDTLVISTGLASTGAEVAWLRNFIDSKGPSYVDCIGVQYIEGALPPDAVSGDSRDSYYTHYFSSTLDMYTSILGSETPLCLTNIGYLSSEGLRFLPEPFAWASDITDVKQAAWLAEAALMASNSGRVRLMIVQNVDYTAADNGIEAAGYAIIRPDGTCRACAALAAIR